MSFRIRDIHSVHNNPLNKSISKQQYSIPKAERFQRCHTVMSDKYYEIQSTNDHKAPSFPTAERKTEFIRKSQVPPPNRYEIKDINLSIKDITFANGREQCKNRGFLENHIASPGPAAYSPNPQMMLKSNTKFSFSHQKSRSKMVANDNPGPGSYPVKSSLLEKDKILSNERKTGCLKITQSTFTRSIGVKLENFNAPYYYPKQNSTGKETFNKTGGFSIGKGERFRESKRVKSEVPGPGSYNQFSEFI